MEGEREGKGGKDREESRGKGREFMEGPSRERSGHFFWEREREREGSDGGMRDIRKGGKDSRPFRDFKSAQGTVICIGRETISKGRDIWR